MHLENKDSLNMRLLMDCPACCTGFLSICLFIIEPSAVFSWEAVQTGCL